MPEAFPFTQFTTLGVGGALALMMFLFYRQDRKESQSLRSESEDRYAELAQDFRQIVQDNTAASVRLAEVIDRLIDGKPNSWVR